MSPATYAFPCESATMPRRSRQLGMMRRWDLYLLDRSSKPIRHQTGLILKQMRSYRIAHYHHKRAGEHPLLLGNLIGLFPRHMHFLGCQQTQRRLLPTRPA